MMKTSDVALILIRLMAIYLLLEAFGVIIPSVGMSQIGNGSIYLSYFFVMGFLAVCLWFIAPFVAMLMVKKIERPLNNELFNDKFQVETTIFTVLGLLLVLTSVGSLIFNIAYTNTEGMAQVDEATKVMVNASNNAIFAKNLFKLIAGLLLMFFSESIWEILAKVRARLLK